MTGNDEPGDRSWLLDNDTDSRAVSEQYDEWASTYDEELRDWGYRSPDEAAELLARYASSSDRVLDAGCGTGLSGVALAAQGFGKLVGVDISAESVRVASARGVYSSVEQGDLQRLPLPFSDSSFDALTCVGVLTYVQDVEATFREFCRLVCAGGPVVFTCRDDLYQERDYARVTKKLDDDGVWRSLYRSEPRPYLPGNDDFGDGIRVIYSAFEVVAAR